MLVYDIVVSKFELQSHYYIHFRTNTLCKGIKLLLFFYKDAFVLYSGIMKRHITHLYKNTSISLLLEGLKLAVSVRDRDKGLGV